MKKIETLLLSSLFAACLMICGLILNDMLTATAPTQLAANSPIGLALTATPSTCALLPDGVVCPRSAN